MAKLKDLEVTKVDFVDNGDNKGANVVLFKRGEEPPPDEPKADNIFRRFVAGLFKSVGATEAQASVIIEEIAKGGGEAETFGEKMLQQQLRRTADEIWDFCYALQESLCSILRDQEVPQANKPGLMTQSLTEFSTAVTAAIPKWASGVPTRVEKSADGQTMTEERLQIAKDARARLDKLIQQAVTEAAPSGADGTKPEGTPADTTPTKTTRGDKADMQIDKSKLTPEELVTLEAIEKKAGIPEGANASATDPVTKSAPADDTEDIYKGMHPAVAAELRVLRKFREEQEDRDMLAIAKKYKLLGKQPEELARVLKSLKDAGGTAYADMIGVLDASLAAVQASPAFNEIGKRGVGAPAHDADAAWTQIEQHAAAIRKAAPGMTYAEAIDKACQDHPDLVHQYEANR